MAKRAELYFNEIIKNELGPLLKANRLNEGFSLGDVAEMTGFPKSTIIKLEKGISSNISYYLAYGQAVKFSIFNSSINLPLVPRFELPPDRKNRKFLTLKVRNLYKNNFFKSKKSVRDVIEEIVRLNDYATSKELSSGISRVLLSFVEDDILKIVERRGRTNIYVNKN
jgi:transcriptional regulator with XRE-family HTH domain